MQSLGLWQNYIYKTKFIDLELRDLSKMVKGNVRNSFRNFVLEILDLFDSHFEVLL